MDLLAWCNRIIRLSFFALVAVVPLVLTPWNYELFEFNKMIVTYALTIIIAGAWVTKMMMQRKIIIRKTILDIPLLLFVVSQLISSLFSMDPHVSWFGYYSRFNGGMLSIFSYVVLFYAFISNWTDETENQEIKQKRTHQLLYVAIASGVAVAVYGVLERMGIDKHLWVQDVQTRVFSTLGQPNWLAAYLVALLPIAGYFTIQSLTKTTKKMTELRLSWQFIIWISINLLFFVTLLFTRSRSGLAALALADTLFWIGALIKTPFRKAVLVAGGTIHLLFFVFIFFNGTYVSEIDKYVTYGSLAARISAPKPAPVAETATPAEAAPSGTMMEYGGTESGTIRKFVWEAAITAWRSTQKTFLIGTGTETFAFAFFQFKPAAHNLTSEWDFLYNKAHNEYLNYLATTGVFGLGSYILFLGVFCLWFSKTVVKKEMQVTDSDHDSSFHSGNSQMALALFSGWVSILVTNFFGFSVVIVQIFLFLFPALVVLLYSHKQSKQLMFSLPNIPQTAARIIELVTLGIATIGVGFVVTVWIADINYAKGYRQSRQGELANAYRNLSQAILLRPQEPNYYDEMSIVLAGISVASMQAQDVTSAATLAQQSLAASDRAIAISPNNVNYWKSRTKIYFGFSDIDPKFAEAALGALEKAFSLSPKDPKIAYNIAVLQGRLGQNDKAIDILKDTVAMKPNYRDAYYALYVFYTEVKQPNLAKAILTEYLQKVDPNDQDFQDKLKQ